MTLKVLTNDTELLRLYDLQNKSIDWFLYEGNIGH